MLNILVYYSTLSTSRVNDFLRIIHDGPTEQRIESCSDIKVLREKITEIRVVFDIGFFVFGTIEELKKLIDIKRQLHSLDIVIVLPDASNLAYLLGTELHPRFILKPETKPRLFKPIYKSMLKRSLTREAFSKYENTNLK